MSAGYDFVPLSKRVSRAPRSQAVFHRRLPGTFSGTVDIVFVAEQQVHIGTGFKRLLDAKIVRRGALVRGRPGIPGSSMKGVLRSRYEAVTLSCAGRPPDDAKGDAARSRTYPDVERATFARVVREMSVFGERDGCSPTVLCPACALFGRMSLRGRISITDLLTREPTAFEVAQISEQFAPRAHHVGDFEIIQDPRGRKMFEIGHLNGRKFALGRGPVAERAKPQYIEVIPQGTALRGQLRLINFLPEELGGLMVALGRVPPSALKVGGGKGHGFGRLVLCDVGWRLRDHTGASAGADEPAWRDRFEAWPDRFPAGEAALVRLHQGDC